MGRKEKKKPCLKINLDVGCRSDTASSINAICGRAGWVGTAITGGNKEVAYPPAPQGVCSSSHFISSVERQTGEREGRGTWSSCCCCWCCVWDGDSDVKAANAACQSTVVLESYDGKQSVLIDSLPLSALSWQKKKDAMGFSVDRVHPVAVLLNVADLHHFYQKRRIKKQTFR